MRPPTICFCSMMKMNATGYCRGSWRGVIFWLGEEEPEEHEFDEADKKGDRELGHSERKHDAEEDLICVCAVNCSSFFEICGDDVAM